MSLAHFNDPGDPSYEVYAGPLGHAVFVRLDGHLVGVCADWHRARALVNANIARRRRWADDNPVFYMAA